MRTSESELLSAFLDKELDSNELKRVKDLLASSSEWREELEQLRSAKTLMATAPALSAPPDLLDFLQRQAAPRSPSRRKRFWEFPRIWVAVSSAATAIVVIGLWVGHHRRSGRPEQLDIAALLAVHNGNQTDLSKHQGIVAAANYSAQLRENRNETL